MRNKKTNMNYKVLFLIGLIFLSLSVIFIYNNSKVTEEDYNFIMDKENKQHQGPVPEGYDLEYFRETGVTKLLE